MVVLGFQPTPLQEDPSSYKSLEQSVRPLQGGEGTGAPTHQEAGSEDETEDGLDWGPLNPDHKIQCSLATSIRGKKKKRRKLCASWVVYLAGVQWEDAYWKEDADYKDQAKPVCT